MVTRDGIEPPTPAFSGPRSTTELPGLSADFKVAFPVRDPAAPVRVGVSTDSALQQLSQYINFVPMRKTQPPSNTRAIAFQNSSNRRHRKSASQPARCN